ncbi:2',3'-cyclic-nucleotide 3'-phosphodiesterase [Lasiosphaeris hirsuta]|uniref:2',3'-cyclic-nucleotide 3'-phosphodiesterase n=1 Tax=Lasiosphaeris hirsuta TaxID=260670 RepID=A0AA40A241_9PEZI|nr:2',3'-cyclic-nucleotide 3'-phosphodiesterase [Lasiosphaeris hirsuta]
MPHTSLWLLPPPTHPLHSALTTLISHTLPALLPLESTAATLSPHFFAPHLTLTSDILPSTYGADPQAWLDSLPFPAGEEVQVRFERVVAGDVFVRRCYVKVGIDGVRGLARVARGWGVSEGRGVEEKTEDWLRSWERGFGPHVSLIYGSVSIDEDALERLTRVVEEAGVKLSGGKSGSEVVDGSDGGGWTGGVVWLVPTDRPIAEWKPIAVREL